MKRIIIQAFTLLAFFAVQKISAKKYNVRFHQNRSELIISLDENEDGTISRFYYVQSNTPLSKRVLKDGKYSITLKGHKALILRGEGQMLIFTVSTDYIQAVFRQKTFNFLVNGIVYGTCKKPVSFVDLLKRFHSLQKEEMNKTAFSDIDIKLAVCTEGYRLYCDPVKELCKCFKEEEPGESMEAK